MKPPFSTITSWRENLAIGRERMRGRKSRRRLFMNDDNLKQICEDCSGSGFSREPNRQFNIPCPRCKGIGVRNRDKPEPTKPQKMGPGWVPSYSDPDNSSFADAAEPIDDEPAKPEASGDWLQGLARFSQASVGMRGDSCGAYVRLEEVESLYETDRQKLEAQARRIAELERLNVALTQSYELQLAEGHRQSERAEKAEHALKSWYAEQDDDETRILEYCKPIVGEIKGDSYGMPCTLDYVEKLAGKCTDLTAMLATARDALARNLVSVLNQPRDAKVLSDINTALKATQSKEIQ